MEERRGDGQRKGDERKKDWKRKKGKKGLCLSWREEMRGEMRRNEAERRRVKERRG